MRGDRFLLLCATQASIAGAMGDRLWVKCEGLGNINQKNILCLH